MIGANSENLSRLYSIYSHREERNDMNYIDIIVEEMNKRNITGAMIEENTGVKQSTLSSWKRRVKLLAG